MSTSTFFKHLSCTLKASRFRCFTKLTAGDSGVGATTWHRSFIATAASQKSREITSKPRHITLFSAWASQAHSPYLSVNVLCPEHLVESFSEALFCFGASSTTVDEGEGDKCNEVWINAIFTEGHDVKLSISQAADSIGLKQAPSFKISVGDQYDWVSKSQESFNPVRVTQGLWIVPQWKDPPDVEAINVMLNPGLAFGTGEHQTTKLCLLLLHASIKGGESFFDYGTGSGVLAIAAIKLGCSVSVGVDIDPQAISSATQNAALNKIGPEKLQLHTIPEKPNSVGASEEKYDLVIANILLNPLLDLAEEIVSRAKPGAIVGLSGVLAEQVPYIMGRYSAFLDDMSVTEMDEWACVRGTKKRNPTV